MVIKLKNLCALIPESLHARVREEQERSGKNLGEYMTMLINEYYDLKEGGKMKEKDTDMKVLAVQIPAELFDARDEYIARHNIKSKKELITSLIRKLLEEDAPAEEQGKYKRPAGYKRRAALLEVSMYIYPDNLKARPLLRLWELRDVAIIAIVLLLSVFALSRNGSLALLIDAAAHGN